MWVAYVGLCLPARTCATRDASVPRRWPVASTTNQLRSTSLARGLYVLFIVLALSSFSPVVFHGHSPEHQSVSRSGIAVEGSLAGIGQRHFDIGGCRPAMAD